RHTRFSRDWSSDVCSSDLPLLRPHPGGKSRAEGRGGALVALRRGRGAARPRRGRGLVSLHDPRIDEEIRHHIEERAERLMAEGRSEERRGGKEGSTLRTAN